MKGRAPPPVALPNPLLSPAPTPGSAAFSWDPYSRWVRLPFRSPDAGFPAFRPSRASPAVRRVEGDGLAAAAASAAASLFAVNTTHLSDSTGRVPIDLAVVRVADGSAA